MPPSGKRFVDTFSGRGNVTWAAMSLLDYQSYWINDKQTKRFFVAIKESVRRLPPTSEINEDTYKITKAKHKSSAMRALLEPMLAFSGGSYEEAGQRSWKGGGVTPSGFYHSFLRARRLMFFYRDRTQITALDWRKVFSELAPDDFAFCDPPYAGAKVGTYKWPIEENIAFRDALLEAKFKWMLTEYRHKIYEPLTEKFGEPEEFRVQRTMTNANQSGRKTVIECVWRNYPTQ